MQFKTTYSINISNPNDYYKQTNNVRAKYASCFNTSMINFAEVGKIKFPTNPVKDKKTNVIYTQPEDIYDYFIENDPELVKWYMNIPSIAKNILSGEYAAREFWDIEVKAFNKWVGKNACFIKYKLTLDDIIKSINNRHPVVISGKFCGFSHVVCIVGYKAQSTEPTAEDLDSLIFDDPYGNPLKNYKPVGVGGNDISMSVSDFWKLTQKSDGSHYAIMATDWESPVK